MHLVTDRVNLAAMKAWFALHAPHSLALFIVDLESFTFLNTSYCPVLKQLQATNLKRFYFSQAEGEAAGDSGLGSPGVWMLGRVGR